MEQRVEEHKTVSGSAPAKSRDLICSEASTATPLLSDNNIVPLCVLWQVGMQGSALIRAQNQEKSTCNLSVSQELPEIGKVRDGVMLSLPTFHAKFHFASGDHKLN